MARRMIDDSIWSNERFAEMPMGARLLMLGIINHADDQGRMKANPIYLRAQIFPYDDVAPSQIQQWLDLMANNETIILYDADGRQYLQLVNWWKYQSLQYAQPSQHPRPSGWHDRIRKTLTKGVIVTCNWLKVNGEPIEDTCDEDGTPLPKRRTPQAPPVPSADDTPDEADENVSDSGDYSGESTPEDTIKLNITKLNITKLNREYIGAPATPPSLSNGSLSPGEYLPGIPDPRQRKGKPAQVAERVMDAKALGVDAAAFRLVVDALLDGFGKKPLADAGDERTLNFAQDIALIVMGISERFRTPAGIASIFQSWKDNDYRGDTVPTSEQFKEHASLMAAGKVVCTRKDNPDQPQAPTPPTFKQWCLKNYGVDNPTFIPIAESILRSRYEQSIRVH